MKKYLIMLLAAVTLAASCDKQPQVNTFKLTVNIELNDAPFTKAGIAVGLKDNNTGVSYAENTDENGIATFKVPVGSYEATANYSDDPAPNKTKVYNGVLSNIIVNANDDNVVTLPLTVSSLSPILIKEMYLTGCTYTDSDGKPTQYHNAKYITLYNNSSEVVDISNLGIAMLAPYNGHGSNGYLVDGVLSYAQSSWVPTATASWYFNTTVMMQPYSQIVIAIAGAIDHTAAYAESVDLSHADFACYDPETQFANLLQYPTPDASIPTSHYMKAAIYSGAKGNAWPVSNSSPAIVIFGLPEGQTVASWAADPNLLDTSVKSSVNQRLVKDYVLDAIEVFSTPNLAKSSKRLTSDLDAGYVAITNTLGYSVYRNVDKAATEAIAENVGKLVYSYSEGTEDLENGSTDPSGIDAEASIKNGAKIVFLDTNNSTKDMHQRKKAALAK